jgi:hypothetical protein
MLKRGWTSLTVQEHVGARIEALTRSQGLTVSNYLDRLMATRREPKVGEEEWMECSICGARLKAKDVPERMSKVHPGGH